MFFGRIWPVWARFGFKKHRTGFQTYNRMPDSGRDIDTEKGFPRTEDLRLQYFSTFVEEYQCHAPAQPEQTFGFGVAQMPMGLDVSPGFHGDQQSLTDLVQTVVEIKVIAQAR